MGFFGKLLGLVLVLVGIYFLGQNIVFTTQTAPYWWRDIPAAGSVIAILSGIMILLSSRDTKELGWGLVAVGIVLVFLSGGVVLRPTSLWTFFLSFVSMAGGYQLLTTGRINF